MMELKNIALTVEGERGKLDILKDISFTLEENKIYVITGPNGGGKSSVAKIIMGIYQPTGGEILFDGKDITNYDITRRAQLGIGYAFQNPPRFKGITVEELLYLAAGGKNDINPCYLLMDVGLCAQDYLHREFNASLSGGELKRIEIATILARNLKVAVFDEPEAGIDLWSFQKLAETFSNIHEKYNTTIVIISHQERILKLADEVILIADGSCQITSKEKVLADIIREDMAVCAGKICEKGVGLDAGCNR